MIKGYKASYDGKCIDLTYEVGKTYTFNGELKICECGFHFCEELKDVFKYYNEMIGKNLIIFEVEILGLTVISGNKSATNKMKIVRILDEKEYNYFLDSSEYDERGNCIVRKRQDGMNFYYQYDDKNNLIHYIDSNNYEEWFGYDERNNLIYNKDSDNYKQFYKYDENNNLVHYKNSDGYGDCRGYDERNNCIYIKHFNERNGSIIVEFWYEYDDNNNVIRGRNSYGNKWENKYDNKNNCISYHNSNGFGYSITIEG